MARYRRKNVRKRVSRRIFKRTAKKVHKKNLHGRTLRGGYRL